MNPLFEICTSELCSGCAACVNICPKKAIALIENDKGFLYPQVNVDKCVNCNLCKQTCPQNFSPKLNAPITIYAGLAKDNEIRKSSSSGGIFSILAEEIFKQNGIVFGAVLQEDMTVCHTYATNSFELNRLKGSKYVQSNIEDSFQITKSFLDNDKFVLFTGTPCQIAGLKNYLKKDYDKLITADILCHGAPSPLVFRKFIKYKMDCNNKSVSNVLFRAKYPTWESFSTKILYSDNTMEYDNSYVRLFLKDLFLRENCHQCQYAHSNRVGDITLGDFWAYKETAPEYIQNDNLGISFISINTNKGLKIFKAVKKKLGLAKRRLEDAAKGNPTLSHATPKNCNSDIFWKDIVFMEWDKLIDKYGVNGVPFHDWISKEDREYFDIPYTKRHRIHFIRCWKTKLIELLKGK